MLLDDCHTVVVKFTEAAQDKIQHTPVKVLNFPLNRLIRGYGLDRIHSLLVMLFTLVLYNRMPFLPRFSPTLRLVLRAFPVYPCRHFC